ncbi:hypothetical protein BIT28_00900 [Photobacterium proteolyticum]|uniref:Peptidase M15A C-terminal domain-containing protein n=1 Tax=Photobacterium proteolyticum TaxID=1903952 RepID=A0A1Q9GXF6_9GAMM|nr:hypothetical protein [Photobacterium proteolyticum]OLQ79841.1 hypothetical protein BIT28_00900 [Photobacterium proteolyticum]
MLEQLLNWHLVKHPQYTFDNSANPASIHQLRLLSAKLLMPIEHHLGTIKITYGFTSHALLRFILNNSPRDIAPDIDQHASLETNSRGNRICKRDGAACDFLVSGYENRMDEVAKFIVQHLTFDRLYFYGKNKPLHISIGPENTQYVLIRRTRSDGLRVNKKSAKGLAAVSLFDDL